MCRNAIKYGHLETRLSEGPRAVSIDLPSRLLTALYAQWMDGVSLFIHLHLLRTFSSSLYTGTRGLKGQGAVLLEFILLGTRALARANLVPYAICRHRC